MSENNDYSNENVEKYWANSNSLKVWKFHNSVYSNLQNRLSLWRPDYYNGSLAKGTVAFQASQNGELVEKSHWEIVFDIPAINGK